MSPFTFLRTHLPRLQVSLIIYKEMSTGTLVRDGGGGPRSPGLFTVKRRSLHSKTRQRELREETRGMCLTLQGLAHTHKYI